MYRLFSAELSYFSGKIRAYLRFKQSQGDLGPGYEDIIATPELIQGLLIPRSGSGAVPQLEAPDGTWVQDSSEIIDYCEARHTGIPILPDPRTAPRQFLTAYLIELLADEWTVVPAFWQRWYFSEEGHAFSHRAFNEQQWGAFVAPGASGSGRRAAGAAFFEQAFGISETRVSPKGVYAGLVHLGCTEETARAWQASQHRLLVHLEAHFAQHDFVLGGRPSLADYGLLGPLYAHLYRDPVPGFYLRTHFPLVTEWVERTNQEGALNSRVFGQKLYSLDEAGDLVPRIASSDQGEWLPGDQIPDTLIPVLTAFFEEMWPVLESSASKLREFIASPAHTLGDELPGKTFTATPGFFELQLDGGPLSHAFEIGGIASRRMVIPYQLWMWQRIQKALAPATAAPEARTSLEEFLGQFQGGSRVLDPGALFPDFEIRKQGARLYSEARSETSQD